jgi:hypothetical protein
MWALYVVAAVLCVASVPTGALVVAGHALVCVAVAISVRRDAGLLGPLVKRLAVVFGTIALLCLQLFAPVVSRAGSAVETAWNEPDAGSGPFTTRFARELAESVTGGSGPAVFAAVAMLLVLGALVAARLVRWYWPLMLALTLGPLLHVVLVVVRGLALSPRFLLALLFPAVFVAVEAARRIAAWVAGRRTPAAGRQALLEGVVIGLVALALVAPLVRTLGVPKQPYTAALAFAAALDPEALLVGIYTASSGVDYYGVEHPDSDAGLVRRTVTTARTRDQLAALLAESGDRRLVLLTSQEASLRDGRPGLYRMVLDGWRPEKSFRAAIGGGDITVWLPRR